MPTQEQRRCEYEQYSWGTLVKHCTRTTKLVERDGQWYCWQHDPVRVAERRATRSKKWDEKWALEAAERKRKREYTEAEQEAAALIVRLAMRLERSVGSTLPGMDIVYYPSGHPVNDLGQAIEILALAARLEATNDQEQKPR